MKRRILGTARLATSPLSPLLIVRSQAPPPSTCPRALLSSTRRLSADSKTAFSAQTVKKREHLFGAPAYSGPGGPRPTSPTGMSALAGLDLGRQDLSGPIGQLFTGPIDGLMSDPLVESAHEEPYHFHVYSHNHNTHVTVTKPNREPILTLSSGDLGYKKAKRKVFEAAYQLLTFSFMRLKAMEWEDKISRLELVLNGFGQGREAATKIFMTDLASNMRRKVVRVSDSTKIKFGGNRSPNRKRR